MTTSGILHFDCKLGIREYGDQLNPFRLVRRWRHLKRAEASKCTEIDIDKFGFYPEVPLMPTQQTLNKHEFDDPIDRVDVTPTSRFVAEVILPDYLKVNDPTIKDDAARIMQKLDEFKRSHLPPPPPHNPP